ncbi:MAG: hypothetical protein J7M30_04775, partial [Deltaproteobacteria bacterium]|nr:hypothetical protein [Deltaproteobacteria bacterium]
GQVLFTPDKAGQTITFEIPVETPGRYRINALVTKGLDYALFSVNINGKPTVITYTATRTAGKKRFSVEHKKGVLFNANTADKGYSESQVKVQAAPEAHTVSRIGMGEVQIEQKNIYVSFVAENGEKNMNKIGIDQFIIAKITNE